MVSIPLTPALKRLMQEDCSKSEAFVSYVVKLVFRKTTQNVSKSGVTVHEPLTVFGVEEASTRDLKINPSYKVSLGS